MAKGFQTLIRLHQWRVDEKRRALGQLLSEAVQLEGQATTLENEIQSEKQTALADPVGAGAYYGAYAAAAIDKRHNIAAAREELEGEIAVAQDEMRKEYRDLKSYELSQEARDNREEAERMTAEQAVLDELGLELFRRRATR